MDAHGFTNVSKALRPFLLFGLVLVTSYPDVVRVPKSALLSRFSQVDGKGNYSRVKANSKLMYNSMMGARASMIRAGASSLARAATVAVRYSAVRRQTANLDPVAVKDKIGEEFTRNASRPAETQILNYPQQQVSLVYVSHSSGVPP